MFCRPIILCLLNHIPETIQVTEGRILASPVLQPSTKIQASVLLQTPTPSFCGSSHQH